MGWFQAGCPSRLNGLKEMESLRFARPAYMSTKVGSVTSQGDAAMRSDDARSTFGVTDVWWRGW